MESYVSDKNVTDPLQVLFHYFGNTYKM